MRKYKITLKDDIELTKGNLHVQLTLSDVIKSLLKRPIKNKLITITNAEGTLIKK